MQTAVKERPIIFSGEMVRAILAGRKTQIRRVISPQPPTEYWQTKIVAEWYEPIVIRKGMQEPGSPVFGFASEDEGWVCPYGAPGGRLWIKTSYTTRFDSDRNQTYWSWGGGFTVTHGRALSKSGRPKRDGGHPGMFMPHWLSQEFRLPVLEVTDVRVQRVQEISEKDAVAEGCSDAVYKDGVCVAAGECLPSAMFRGDWDFINGKKHPWESNPWVWAISFRVHGCA